MIDAVYQWLAHHIAHNEMFAGFVAFGLVATAPFYLKWLASSAYTVFLRHFTVHLVIVSTDEAFVWVSDWVNTTSYIDRMRRMRVVNAIDRTAGQESGPGEDGPVGWVFAVGPGRHWFFHDGALVVFERTIDKEASKGFQIVETISLRLVGRSRRRVLAIIEAARRRQEAPADYTKIATWKAQHYWHVIGARPPRELSTIVMDDKAKASLVRDLRWFVSSKDWYADKGVPYHRGYLLTGAPGTGKSSLATAMAYKFNRAVFVLNLASLSRDAELVDALLAVPKGAFLLIEDIDAATTKRTTARAPAAESGIETEDDGGVSLSALLNCLDGLLTPDGQIVFMTTNHPEKLDPALTRPGRVDLRVDMAPLGHLQAEQLFSLFFPDSRVCIGRSAPPRPAADIQQICIAHRGSPEAAAKAIESG